MIIANSLFNFLANFSLMYGITELKPSFIKVWLIVGIIEIFGMLLACDFELMLLSTKEPSYTTQIMVILFLSLFFSVVVYLWIMVDGAYHKLLKRSKVQMMWKKNLVYTLTADDVQIEKGNGKYMRF